MNRESEKPTPPRLAAVGTVATQPIAVPPAPAALEIPTSASSSLPAAAPDLKVQSEYLWNTHKYKNDYIRFADTKAAFTVTFCSAILAALFKGGLHQLFLATAPKAWNADAWVALGSFLSLAVSIGAGVWTIRPRLSSRQPKGLIYWGGIAEHGSAEAFWNSMKSQSQEQLTEHLAHHVFRLSQIAKQKFFWVSVSMTAAAVGGGLASLNFLFR